MIDFKVLTARLRKNRKAKFLSLTAEQQKVWIDNIKSSRRANRSYAVVRAYDDEGFVFEKPLKVYPSEYPDWKNHAIVDFGSHGSYYLSDLLKSYPFDKPLCVDACGRNHRGFAVWISVDEINLALALAQKIAQRKNLVFESRK